MIALIHPFLTVEQYNALIAEAERISAEMERDSSKIVTHAELKQRLANHLRSEAY